MQIHELNTFVGTASSSDYLAIDSGTTTTKISATNLTSIVSVPVTDVQVNGTSVVSSKIGNIQDSDFLSAATIAKWDAILGI